MMFVFFCLDTLETVKGTGIDQVRVTYEPREVGEFLAGGFGFMNEMCKRGGMSELQIYERTKALFDYFQLPS